MHWFWRATIVGAGVVRRVVIILLLLATLFTGGLWVLSCLQWPGRWYGRIFDIGIHHSPPGYGVGGWWALHGYHRGSKRDQCVSVRDGRIRLVLSKATRPFSTPGYEWRRGNLSIRRQSGWWESTLEIRMPLWLPFTLFVTYPTIAFIRGLLRRHRRHRRRRKDLCLICGYNLTGNVSGVCPECGERI